MWLAPESRTVEISFSTSLRTKSLESCGLGTSTEFNIARPERERATGSTNARPLRRALPTKTLHSDPETPHTETMQVIEGIPVWGDPVDQGALEQIKNCMKTRSEEHTSELQSREN